jgi:hypothetical protein
MDQHGEVALESLLNLVRTADCVYSVHTHQQQQLVRSSEVTQAAVRGRYSRSHDLEAALDGNF